MAEKRGPFVVVMAWPSVTWMPVRDWEAWEFRKFRQFAEVFRGEKAECRREASAWGRWAKDAGVMEGRPGPTVDALQKAAIEAVLRAEIRGERRGRGVAS